MSFLKNSKENERKALVRVLEVDSSGSILKKILGFGVKMKKNEETNSYMFITSSSVLRSPDCLSQGSKIVAERYCSQYPKHIDKEDHREKVYNVVSSVDDHVSFAFFEGKSEEGFLEIDDETFFETLAMHKTLYAYAFEGKEIVELTFQDKDSRNDYKLTSVSKKDFQVQNAKGAPVIAYDRYSEKPMVVGILHITSDGTLFPVFITKDNLQVKSEPKGPKEPQERDTPKDEENGSMPNGGENSQQEVTPEEEKNGSVPNGGENSQQEVTPDDEKNGSVPNCGENSQQEVTPEKKGSMTQGGENSQQGTLVTDEPDRGIHPSDDKAAKQMTVVTGFSQQEVKASAPVLQETTKCFKHETINDALPDKLRIRLKIKLDPDRQLGGDIRSLADAYGYTFEEINFLKNFESPTQKFLKENGDSTLGCLKDKLENIQRHDAAKLIEDYIKEKCECEECTGGSLR